MYKKFKRVKSKIENIVQNCECPVWLTLTFNQDKINIKSHRQIVYRYLKSQTNIYVANIDFGDKKNRMHYHAVVGNKIDTTIWIHKYGGCKASLINNKDNNKLAEYITKLSYHAVKNSTKGFKTIYSRKKEDKEK